MCATSEWVWGASLRKLWCNHRIYADAEVNTLAHMNNIMFHHEDILIINITETEFFSCALGTRVVRFFWVFSKTVPALLTPATAALVVCGGVRKAHQLCVIGNCRRPQQKDQYKNRTTLFLHIIKGNNCTSLLRFYIIYLASPKTNTLYVYSVALTVCRRCHANAGTYKM